MRPSARASAPVASFASSGRNAVPKSSEIPVAAEDFEDGVRRLEQPGFDAVERAGDQRAELVLARTVVEVERRARGRQAAKDMADQRVRRALAVLARELVEAFYAEDDEKSLRLIRGDCRIQNRDQLLALTDCDWHTPESVRIAACEHPPDESTDGQNG